MLAYSMERYLPTHSNIITLDCPAPIGGYIYTGIKGYNTGLILSQETKYLDKFSLDEIARPDNLTKRVSVEELFDKLPNPLKPLAFLLYLTKEEYMKFSEQIGALNIILQSIHPTYLFQTPKDKRPNFSFSPMIQMEWENDWKTFFDSCIKFDDIVNPKRTDEKFPIFVINASQVENNLIPPYYAKQPLSQSNHFSMKEDGSAVLDIDFDSLPDIQGDNQIAAIPEQFNQSESEMAVTSSAALDTIECNPAYLRLLNMDGDEA